MPSNHELEIIMKLKDEISKKLAGVEGTFRKLSNSTREVALEMRKAGREMSYVGTSMAAVGTAIIAPLALAYKNAGNFNAEIAHQLRETQNVFNNLSVSIGKSLLPIMRQLTNSIANVVSWWNNLDQAVRDRIISSIYKLGITLIGLGTALMIVGHSLSFLANLALLTSTLLAMNPVVLATSLVVLAVVGGFIALAVAMLKWKPVADTVINTLVVLGSVAGQTADYLLILWNVMKLDFKAVKKDWEDIGAYSKKIQDVMSGKGSSEAEGFDKIKKNLGDFVGWWKEFQAAISGGDNKNKNPAGGFWSGFEYATTEAMDKLRDFQQLGKDVATQLTTNLANAFSNFIDDAFSGQLKRAQDYFAAFGKSILSMFGQVIAKMIANWMMVQAVIAGKQLVGNILSILGQAGSIAGGVGGHTVNTGTQSVGGHTFTTAWSPYHTGGIVRAHSGLAVDEVPIIAQRGERVLSRSQNAEYEKGGATQPIIVFKVWDYADIARHESEIIAMVGRAVGRNGSLRGQLKKYT